MSNDEITLDIPPSLEKYTVHLGLFFAGMIEKLAKNSHKETPTVPTIPAILDLLQLELDEFEEQFYDDRNNENTLIELMDVSNFAFLAYIALRIQGVKYAKEVRNTNP